MGYLEFGKDQMDYESAKTYCEGAGEGLVEIFNQEQMDFVGKVSNKMSILTIFVYEQSNIKRKNFINKFDIFFIRF